MRLWLGLLAGASFFYKPGTLPYEAQEVLAFGLFLRDMLDRLEEAGKAAAMRASLEEITASALEEDPGKRPTFETIAARCCLLTTVRATSAHCRGGLTRCFTNHHALCACYLIANVTGSVHGREWD